MLEHLTTGRIAAGTLDMRGLRQPCDGNIRERLFFQWHGMLDALAGAHPYTDR